MVRQGVQGARPEGPVVAKPVLGLGQGLRFQGAAMDPTSDRTLDQARILQHPNVLGDRSEGHLIGLNKVCDARRPLGKAGQDSTAGAVPEGLEEPVESRLFSIGWRRDLQD